MRVYFSPTVGRSCDLPADIQTFLESEECEYRSTCPSNLLTEGDGDYPDNFGESLPEGREIVREMITTFNGEVVEYTSWDHVGQRYYMDFDSMEDLDSFICALNKPVTFTRRDPENSFQNEFMEAVWGMPNVGDHLLAEIETTIIPPEAYEYESEGEEWKQ